MTFARRNLVILTFGTVVACGGRPPVVVAPAPAAPEATVEQFLVAVRDADLGRMAELWGDQRGPSTLNVPQQQRVQRLTIMQRVLQNDEHRVVGTQTPQSQPNRRILQVEMTRDGRRFVVPFTLVIARTGGWLINDIGYEAAIAPPAGRSSP